MSCVQLSPSFRVVMVFIKRRRRLGSVYILVSLRTASNSGEALHGRWRRRDDFCPRSIQTYWYLKGYSSGLKWEGHAINTAPGTVHGTDCKQWLSTLSWCIFKSSQGPLSSGLWQRWDPTSFKVTISSHLILSNPFQHTGIHVQW